MHSENVDVVEEHAQWMDENSNAPPTMDSHVLAVDLTPALFVRVSLTDLGRSHGGTLREERSKSTSGQHWHGGDMPGGGACLEAASTLTC